MEHERVDIQGWMDAGECNFIAEHAIALPTDSLIIEIGAWLGKSTVAMASVAKDKRMVTIDTWQGQPDLRETMHKLATTGKLLDMWIDNCRRYGLDPKPFVRQDCENGLYYLTSDSREAASLFRDKSVDMWFDDGDHHILGEDIDVWKPKWSDNCLVCGHDYGNAEWAGMIGDALHARFDNIKVFGVIWYL